MLSFDTREIARFARGLERLRADMPVIAANEMRKQIVEFAASGRNPDGSAWSPLQKRYAARKQKLVGNSLPNKRLTGGLLQSVGFTAVNGTKVVIAPDTAHMAQAQGLEKKRVSFEASPISAQNVERTLLDKFNSI